MPLAGMDLRRVLFLTGSRYSRMMAGGRKETPSWRGSSEDSEEEEEEPAKLLIATLLSHGPLAIKKPPFLATKQ